MHDLAYNQRTKEVVSDNLDVTEAPFNHDDSIKNLRQLSRVG